jgi:PAS domain S-box-containing protein
MVVPGRFCPISGNRGEASRKLQQNDNHPLRWTCRTESPKLCSSAGARSRHWERILECARGRHSLEQEQGWLNLTFIPEGRVAQTDRSSSAFPDAVLAHRILEAAPTIIYVYDIQAERSVFQNRRFGELLGHNGPVTPDGDWKEYVHPDDALRFREHRHSLKTIDAGETLFWEFRMQAANGQWRWFLSRDVLLSADAAGKPHLIVGSATDITEQKNAEEHKEILFGEMRHRAKNLISLVEAIGRLSRPRNRPDVDAFIDAYMERLKAILRTGDIVLSSDARTADLQAVIETAIAPFQNEQGPTRIAVKGPSVALPERTAGSVALAFHELATNAMKYGALSVPSGSVSIRWSLTGGETAEHFAMEWKESGGPPVSPPNTEGFGGRVIRHSIAHEANGKIALDYMLDGLRCGFTFDIPRTQTA